MTDHVPDEGPERRRSDVGARIRELLRLERPSDRAILALVLVAAALTSPFLALPGGLPSIRLDQVVLVVAAIPLLRYVGGRPEARRLGVVDLAFAAFAAATTLSIVLGPVITGDAGRSYRDAFEIVRIAEYWLAYRIGRSLVPPAATSYRVARLLGASAVVLGLLAIVQYLDPPRFNDIVTAIWAEAHNLLGVTREGRAVGTAGNANQFGILAVILVFVALAARIARARGLRDLVWVAPIVLATIGLGLAQSRGAILGAAIGLPVAAGLLALTRDLRRSVALTAPAVGIGAVAVIALALVWPPESGGILTRFDPTAFARDPSLAVRIGRVEEALGGGPAAVPGDDAEACAEALRPLTGPAPGHEPGAASPPAAPTADARRAAEAVADHYCVEGRWPDTLDDLVPDRLAAVPRAEDGLPYALYTSSRGFAVGTAMSEPGSEAPEGTGTLPNLIANASFEADGTPPARWLVTAGADLERAADGPAFGEAVGRAALPERGSVHQLVVASLPPRTAFTFSAWVRAGDPQPSTVQLYVVGITTGGETLEPMAVASADLSGDPGWRPIAVTFRTPSERLASVRLMVRAPDAPVRLDLDGVSFVEGPFMLPFASLVDRPATSAGLVGGPTFWDSPIIGIGPAKEQASAVWDNEFAWLLVHYGIVGLVAFGALLGSVFVVSVRAVRRAPGWGRYLGVAVAASVAALVGFAISAGAYRQLQVMVIFWLLAGVTGAIAEAARHVPSVADDGAAATRP